MSLKTCIEAMAVRPLVLNSVTLPVYHGETLPSKAETAILPARLIVLFGEEGNASEVQQLALSPGVSQVTWTFYELILLEPLGQTRGFPDMMPLLRDCADAYALLLRDVALITPTAVITRATGRTGAIKYGGVEFYGIQWTVSVQEIY